MSGTVSPSEFCTEPSVLKTGPGRWITNEVGSTVSASSANSATVRAQTPTVVRRDMRRRGAGTIVVPSSNSATADPSGRSFAIGVQTTPSPAVRDAPRRRPCD